MNTTRRVRYNRLVQKVFLFILANASIFGAYAEGPSAYARAAATHVPYTPIATATVGGEASLFKAGVKAGPAVAELNPNLTTRASISTTGVSAQLLGFGFSLGNETSISTPLGKFGFNFWGR